MISQKRWDEFINDIMPDNLIKHAKENEWLKRENENNNKIIDDWKGGER